MGIRKIGKTVMITTRATIVRPLRGASSGSRIDPQRERYLLSETPTNPLNPNQARAIGPIAPKSGSNSEAEGDLSSSLLVPGRCTACQRVGLTGKPLASCEKR
jgi:hypothetical protein